MSEQKEQKQAQEPRMISEALIPSGVGEGWWPLLEELQDRLDEISPGWQPVQVKEKFGQLRIYADPAGKTERAEVDLGQGRKLPVIQSSSQPGDDQDFRAAIHEAEAKSATICEECGAPAGMRRSKAGWFRTICEQCGAPTLRQRPRQRLQSRSRS